MSKLRKAPRGAIVHIRWDDIEHHQRSGWHNATERVKPRTYESVGWIVRWGKRRVLIVSNTSTLGRGILTHCRASLPIGCIRSVQVLWKPK